MRFSRRLALAAAAIPVAAIFVSVVYLASAGEQASVRQPIAFSHRLHADEKQISCVYCHQGVKRSATAGLPSVEKCMGCHKTIAVDRPEVRKIADYWEKKEPIAWARVNYLPDHVRFTHQQHVLAGVECLTCHGAPNGPDGSFAALRPGMSWCLDCHRQNDASIDCATCHK